MRPIRVTVSSQTASAPIPMDSYRGPFNVGVGVVISAGGSLTYTVQHTFDDVFAKDFTPATATWFSNVSLSSKTTSSDGNYSFPVTAIRLNVVAWASGSATMTLIQAGMPGE